jgi:hypothetical protein
MDMNGKDLAFLLAMLASLLVFASRWQANEGEGTSIISRYSKPGKIPYLIIWGAFVFYLAMSAIE